MLQTRIICKILVNKRNPKEEISSMTAYLKEEVLNFFRTWNSSRHQCAVTLG